MVVRHTLNELEKDQDADFKYRLYRLSKKSVS
jgi:hypothetical protein